jgi:glycosyltransferase involved in cell wall biosynthesis
VRRSPSPDVSVIICTCGRPAQLAEALASVLAQRDVDIELLVVDDSADRSAAPVVNRLADGRVSYLANPSPSGGRPGIVRNMAWPRVRGAVVHFLDDDDVVATGYYRAALDALAAAPDTGVVFGAIEPFGDDPAAVSDERRYFADAARRARACARLGSKLPYAASMFFDATLLVCSAAVIRRECVALLNGFDPDLPVNEDVDFFGRAMRRFGARFIPATCIYRRVWPSLIRQPDVQRLLDRSYRRMHANYRAQWGTAEFLAMKGFARTVLKVIA